MWFPVFVVKRRYAELEPGEFVFAITGRRGRIGVGVEEIADDAAVPEPEEVPVVTIRAIVCDVGTSGLGSNVVRGTVVAASPGDPIGKVGGCEIGE